MTKLSQPKTPALFKALLAAVSKVPPRLTNESDLDDEPGELEPVGISADVVAVAWCLSGAFESGPDFLPGLVEPGSISLLRVPAPAYTQKAAWIIERYIRNQSRPVFTRLGIGNGALLKPAPDALALLNFGDRTREDDIVVFRRAADHGLSVLAISHDAQGLVPLPLLKFCDRDIVVKKADGAAVAASIQEVTGHSVVVSDRAAAALELDDLSIFVRPGADVGAITRKIQRVDNSATRPPLKLADLHGLGEAREWAQTLVRDLREFEKGMPWENVAATGVLLSSPPGCGKTMLGRAIASEVGPSCEFLDTSYAQWQTARGSGHLGDVTKEIRRVFSPPPAGRIKIVFCDEYDTVPARGTGTHNDTWFAAINTCLLEMLDGFKSRSGLVVIAATNFPAKIDPAMTRSGRLETHIRIPRPSFADLALIFQSLLGDMFTASDAQHLAAASPGATGADAAKWIREGKRTAREAGRPLSVDDVHAAILRGTPWLSKPDRLRLAYHETAHILVADTLKVGRAIAASVLARDGGITFFDRPANPLPEKNDILDEMAQLLAGRAAERMVFGEMHVGLADAESDCARATSLACRLEGTWGLGGLGALWISAQASLEQLPADARERVKDMLTAAEKAATAILEVRRHDLDAMAAHLAERGTLGRADIDRHLAKPRRLRPEAQVPTIGDVAQ